MSTPINPKDVWYMDYFSMSDEEKSAQLVRLIRRINEEEPATAKRDASRYLKGIVLRKKTDPYVEKLILHFETFVDERGISGYITKPMATEEGMIPESFSASAWRSLMNRVMKQVKTLRKHSERAPFRKKMGTRPALYCTDTCDLVRLYNLREDMYDYTNKADATKMVELVTKSEIFAASRPGISIRMIDIAPAVNDKLFPVWSIKEVSQFSQFVQTHLIPALREAGQDWSQSGPTLNRRR